MQQHRRLDRGYAEAVELIKGRHRWRMTFLGCDRYGRLRWRGTGFSPRGGSLTQVKNLDEAIESAAAIDVARRIELAASGAVAAPRASL